MTEDRPAPRVVVSTLTSEAPRLELLSEEDLLERMKAALTSSSPVIRTIGEQLSQMALEAKLDHDHYLSRRSREVRWFYRIGSWSYGGLSAVITAAVGGAVLAFSQWPAWLRYTIGTASLIAAFVGALRPSDYLARDLQRKDLYQAFHRWIWQYILIGLPSAKEDHAKAMVDEFGHALDSIRGIDRGFLAPARSSSSNANASTTQAPTTP